MCPDVAVKALFILVKLFDEQDTEKLVECLHKVDSVSAILIDLTQSQ